MKEELWGNEYGYIFLDEISKILWKGGEWKGMMLYIGAKLWEMVSLEENIVVMRKTILAIEFLSDVICSINPSDGCWWTRTGFAGEKLKWEGREKESEEDTEWWEVAPC